MTNIKIILVAGARPNFMKISPLMNQLKKNGSFHPVLVHTGQHYDEKMSDLFFKQLGIPEPDVNLEVGSASHAVQMARIMERFEKVCLEEKPDAVLVVGDVNSTAACVLVAAKLYIKTIHYESGLRSYDRSMPEEINRIVTDSICDYYFTTSPHADEILISEGKKKENIFMCGDLMIDSLAGNLKKVENTDPEINLLNGKKKYPLKDPGREKYGLITIHRPSNVDDKENLKKIIISLGNSSEKVPMIFPIHPRTMKNINEFDLRDLLDSYPGLLIIEPMGYLEFISLLKNSMFLLSDSGGIQVETTWLNIPCLTLRENTERPLTISMGTNKLIGPEIIESEIALILDGKGKNGKAPSYWDGKSAERIIKVLADILKK